MAACDVTADVAVTGGQTGYHKVTVKVTDVAEAGKVILDHGRLTPTAPDADDTS